MTRTLIIGSGLAGLSCGYHLEKAGIPFQILERRERPGGLCRTDIRDGFAFDQSIHILYSSIPHVRDLITRDLLRKNLSIQDRHSYCYTRGRFTEYPYQAHNHGLPSDVIVDNLLGPIEATYNGLEGKPKNFEEWIVDTFGEGIARNFMLPYNRKLWAWDLKQINYDWIAGRVPRPTVRDVLTGAIEEPSKRFGPNHQFWYPETGGIEALPRGLASRLSTGILVEHTVRVIDPVAKTVVAQNADGDEVAFDYDFLVATVPIPALLKLMSRAPAGAVPAAEDFKYNVVHTVNLGLRGPELPPFHWVYFPSDESVFHRISFPHRFSPWMAPAGCQSIMCEISESVQKPCRRERLIWDCIADLEKVGLIGPHHEIVHRSMTTLDPAYVIYDHRHRENVDTFHQVCNAAGIFPCGRFGDWEYLNMDHSMASGIRIAETIESKVKARSNLITT